MGRRVEGSGIFCEGYSQNPRDAQGKKTGLVKKSHVRTTYTEGILANAS